MASHPRIGLGCAVLNTDDPRHATERRMWAPAVSLTAIQTHWASVNRTIDRNVDAMADGVEFDAYVTLREFAYQAVARSLTGLPEEAVDPSFAAVRTVLDGFRPGDSRESFLDRFTAGRAALTRLLQEAIAEAPDEPAARFPLAARSASLAPLVRERSRDRWRNPGPLEDYADRGARHRCLAFLAHDLHACRAPGYRGPACARSGSERLRGDEAVPDRGARRASLAPAVPARSGATLSVAGQFAAGRGRRCHGRRLSNQRGRA